MSRSRAVTDPRSTADAARATHQRPRLLATGTALLSVALFCVVFRPWQWYMGDLIVYRGGASALLHGRDLYTVVSGRSSLHFTYPPFAAVALAWLAPLPLVAARLVLSALTLLAVAVAVRVAGRRSTLSPVVQRRLAGLGVGVLIWLEPVRATLSLGQINALLMALIAVDLLGRTGRFTGIATGVAAAIKLTPLAFIPYLLVTGRRRSALVAATSFVVCVLIGFLVDPSGSRTYWGDHYFTEAHRIGRVENASNQSILGILARALGTASVPPWWLGIAAVAFVAGLVAARILWRHGRVLWSVTAAAITMLAVSPISWSHHWVWCVVMVVVVLELAITSSSRWVGAAAVSTLLPFVAAMIFWAPHSDHAELADAWWQQLLSATYVIAGVGLIATMLVASRRGRLPVVSANQGHGPGSG